MRNVFSFGAIRFGEDGQCSNYLERCCELTKIQNDPIDGTMPASTPKPKGKQECGQRNADGVGFRITGAKESEAHYGMQLKSRTCCNCI